MDTTTGTPTGGEPGGATQGQVPPPDGTPPAGGPRNGTESFFEWIDRLGLRRTDERWLSGTAGGVARRLGVAPLLVRGLWLVLCLVGGVGLILYAIGWALLPDDRDGRSLLGDAVHGQFRGEMVGPIVAFILGVNWRFGAWSWWRGDDWIAGVFWLCLLAGVAVVVAAVHASRGKDGGQGTQQQQGQPYPGQPDPRQPYPPAPSGDVPAAATPGTPTAAFTAPAAAPYATAPVPPAYAAPSYAAPAPTPPLPAPVATKHHGDAKQGGPRDGRRSGAVASAVVGLCLVAGAVVFGLDRGGHVDSPWLVWGGVSLVLLGLGTVVAGLRGRGAGGLTTLAILLGVLVLPVASLDHTGAFDGDVRAIAPDTTVVATAVATAEAGYT
jgi:phage shock protein PspC (stress-responsive transcriptional regulator)